MRRREAGFSILEVLFAIALIGVCLMGAIQIQIGINRNSERLENRLEEARTARNALAMMREYNPGETSSGAMSLPNGEMLSWRAMRMGGWLRSVGLTKDDGDFDVALYVNEIEVTNRDGKPLSRFSIEQTGWRRRN